MRLLLLRVLVLNFIAFIPETECIPEILEI